MIDRPSPGLAAPDGAAADVGRRVDRLRHRDGACYAGAIDTGDGPRSPRIELCGGGWLQDVESGELVEVEVGLPPYGVRVFWWVTS